MFKNRFFVRGLLVTLLVLAILGVGSYFAYQAGLVRGTGMDGAYVMPHDYANGMPMYGRGIYGHGFGIFPFFFLGGLFKIVLFFALIGLLFRMVFAPWGWRRHRWHGGPGHPGDWGPRGRWVWEDDEYGEGSSDANEDEASATA